MNKVIGYTGNENTRHKAWLSMIESKKSYEHFSKIPEEQAENIAETDMKIYNYYLQNYVAA